MKHKVWIDVGYPPHVLIFDPIIRELKREGHQVIVTAREAFETCSLLDLKDLEYFKIGKHSGKRPLMKVLGTARRAIKLLYFALGKGFSVAASHGSPSQELATKVLRIPCVSITDYEHCIFRLSFFTKMVVPRIIPDDVLRQKNVKLENLVKYDGLKEDIYVKENQNITLKIKAVDPDGDTLTYSISGPFKGSSWNIGYDDAGEYNVTITITDGKGLQDIDTCSVQVMKTETQDSDQDGVPDDLDAAFCSISAMTPTSTRAGLSPNSRWS